MPDNTKQLQELLHFIQEHRSNEANFQKIYDRLEQEIIANNNSADDGSKKFQDDLQEVKDKQAEVYQQAKENGGSAWPEFENFITQLEKSITDAMNESE